MYCFPMLSEAYAAALLTSVRGAPESEDTDAIPVSSSETRLGPFKASAEEEDLETARARPLRRDALHL